MVIFIGNFLLHIFPKWPVSVRTGTVDSDRKHHFGIFMKGGKP